MSMLLLISFHRFFYKFQNFKWHCMIYFLALNNFDRARRTYCTTELIILQSADISLFKILFFRSRICNTIIRKVCKSRCLDYIMRTYHEDRENCMMEDFNIQCRVQAHAKRIIKTGIEESVQSPGFFPKTWENDITR
jgi:hypothetical protein